MESYVHLSLQSRDRIEEFKQAFECLAAFDIDGCRSALEFLPPWELKSFDTLVNQYPEYLEGADELSIEGDSISATFVCGGDGLDFLFHMFVFFGPYADAITANFEHDEEYDEAEFSSITHRGGKLFINGSEVYDQNGQGKNVFEYLSQEVLGILSEESGHSLLITVTPAGEAPEWVRDQWVGMKLPLTIGALNGDFEIDELTYGAESSKGETVDYNSPLVMALDAFTLLKEKSPEAWRWWNENCPDLFGTESALVFNSGSWEVLSH